MIRRRFLNVYAMVTAFWAAMLLWAYLWAVNCVADANPAVSLAELVVYVIPCLLWLGAAAGGVILLQRLLVAARLSYDQSARWSDDPEWVPAGTPTESAAARPFALRYAKEPRWWETITVRRYAGLVLAIALAIVGWLFGPFAWHVAQKSYWERQCLRFDPPSATVVYERHVAGTPVPPTAPPYSGTVARMPSILAQFFRGSGTPPVVVNRIPICWRRYQPFCTPLSAPSSGSVVFCHAMTNWQWQERLVEVELPPVPVSGGDLANAFDAIVYNLADGTAVSDRLMVHFGGGPSLPVPMLPFPKQIFAGRSDPTNSNHFTIEYVWPNGVHGFLDGYLRAGDKVQIIVRPGPGDLVSALNSFEQNFQAWADK